MNETLRKSLYTIKNINNYSEAERYFSTLKRMKTCLQSTMRAKIKRVNNKY